MKYLSLLIKRLKDQGFGYTLGKVWLNGFQRPIMGRVNYRRYRSQYPLPLIFIAGQAKGGSTWFGKMFATLPGFELLSPVAWKIVDTSQTWEHFEATNLKPGIFDEFAGKLAIVKAHTWGFPENVRLLNEWGMKCLITMRDPRDMLISNYYYARNHPENWDHANAMEREFPEYVDFKLEDNRWNRESVDWCRSWLDNRNPETSLILKYEDALADPEALMKKALAFLGFEVSEKTFRTMIDQNTFERMAGRKRGQEDTSSFQRKGVAGEWKTLFSDEQKRRFNRQCEDVLKQLGYEV